MAHNTGCAHSLLSSAQPRTDQLPHPHCGYTILKVPYMCNYLGHEVPLGKPSVRSKSKLSSHGD